MSFRVFPVLLCEGLRLLSQVGQAGRVLKTMCGSISLFFLCGVSGSACYACCIFVGPGKQIAVLTIVPASLAHVCSPMYCGLCVLLLSLRRAIRGEQIEF